MNKQNPIQTRRPDPALAAQMLMNGMALGVDVEHRCIYFMGPIDHQATYRFIAGFKWLDRSPGPIHIILCSEGGMTDQGFAIYDTIRTANNPTVIEGLGIIASAAVPVLLAGTCRFLNPESKVMIHNMSYEVEGTLNSAIVQAMSKETERHNKRYYEILAERTGKSVKDVEKWCQDETTFIANDAIKLGFADKVLETRPLPANFQAGMAEVEELMETWHAAMRPAPEAPRKSKKRKGKRARK
jgi:ATP-dependent Clp protease, protease subunit